MRNTMRNRWQAWQRRARAGLLALLGILPLVLVACGNNTKPPGGALVGTPGPTIPVPPATALTWETASVPAALYSLGPYETETTYSVGLAQSDSATAYVCGQGSGPNLARVYVTHDAARTWQGTGTVDMGAHIDGCGLVVDSLQPSTVVIELFSQSNEPCMGCFAGTFRDFLTRDGGQTWTPFAGPGPGERLTDLATYAGATYAIFEPIPSDASLLQTEFVISRDGMRTWTNIDRDITAGNASQVNGRFATAFWLNPATGALLAESTTDTAGTTRFYSSATGGQSWTPITTPSADQFYVLTPTSNAPWTICGQYTSESNTGAAQPTDTICTSNSGQTWAHRGATYDPFDHLAFGLADDGSLLLLASNAVERLAPGATTVAALGPLPAAVRSSTQLVYVSGSGHGRVWVVPQNGGDPFPADTPLATAVYQ